MNDHNQSENFSFISNIGQWNHVVSSTMLLSILSDALKDIASTLADPDIRLGATSIQTLGKGANLMFPSISRLFLHWSGAKVYSQTGWEATVGFFPWIRHWACTCLRAPRLRTTEMCNDLVSCRAGLGDCRQRSICPDIGKISYCRVFSKVKALFF